METCPHCDKTFDAREHRYKQGLIEGLKPRMPSTHVANFFTVRCPACNITFSSSSLRFLGVFTYSQLPWLVGVVFGLLVLYAWFF